MSDRLNTMRVQEGFEDLSGVEGDGLGEGEVAFEGEEWCWEDWPLQFWLQGLGGLAKGTGLPQEETRRAVGKSAVAPPAKPQGHSLKPCG